MGPIAAELAGLDGDGSPIGGAVRDVLPAFKAFIVKELFTNYNFSQSKIAQLLGITQASVSYYLHEERGKAGLALIQKHDNVQQILLSLTESIAETPTPLDPDFFTNNICELCANMLEEFGCRAARKK